MTDEIFVDPEAIKEFAELIGRYNERIREELVEITGQIEKVEWEAPGNEAMQESFSDLRIEFDLLYEFISRTVNFLNQNVAEEALVLDEVIRQNVSEITGR